MTIWQCILLWYNMHIIHVKLKLLVQLVGPLLPSVWNRTGEGVFGWTSAANGSIAGTIFGSAKYQLSNQKRWPLFCSSKSSIMMHTWPSRYCVLLCLCHEFVIHASNDISDNTTHQGQPCRTRLCNPGEEGHSWRIITFICWLCQFICMYNIHQLHQLDVASVCTDMNIHIYIYICVYCHNQGNDGVYLLRQYFQPIKPAMNDSPWYPSLTLVVYICRYYTDRWYRISVSFDGTEQLKSGTSLKTTITQWVCSAPRWLSLAFFVPIPLRSLDYSYF